MKEQITIMLNGTMTDMFGEYRYFLKEIYPELRDFCQSHGILLKYLDISYDMPFEDAKNKRALLNYLEYVDLDRTFFICFRGQRFGWIPSPNDVDSLTLDIYPELVQYITTISITDLSILHALIPFYKNEQGEVVELKPVKHSFFYFRRPDYIGNLDAHQQLVYTNRLMGDDEEIGDMNLARAKDLVYEIKEQFDEDENNDCEIKIRQYDGIWDADLNMFDVLFEYTDEYARIKDKSTNEFMKIYQHSRFEGDKGCFYDFEFEEKPLKDVIIQDFKEALLAEFPDCFE